MNRADFGKILASLRRELEDDQGRPWSQERLAEEANSSMGVELFTQRIIGTIEQGRRSLEPEILLPLGDALQLTSSEREQFFFAACGIDNERLARHDNDPNQILRQLLDRMEQLSIPAHIMDSYCDILAINSAGLELINSELNALVMSPVLDRPFPNNWIRTIFASENISGLSALMGEYWPEYARTALMTFRASSLRYRATEYFQALLQELRRSRLFKLYWRQACLEDKDQFSIGNMELRLNSAKWGSLIFCTATTRAAASAGDLHLFVYAPASRDTIICLSRILSGTPKPLRVDDYWPRKRLPLAIGHRALSPS